MSRSIAAVLAARKEFVAEVHRLAGPMGVAPLIAVLEAFIDEVAKLDDTVIGLDELVSEGWGACEACGKLLHEDEGPAKDDEDGCWVCRTCAADGSTRRTLEARGKLPPSPPPPRMGEPPRWVKP